MEYDNKSDKDPLKHFLCVIDVFGQTDIRKTNSPSQVLFLYCQVLEGKPHKSHMKA